METDTKAEVTPDWWSTGRGARNITQTSPPPVVVYPSHDYNRSRVGPALTVAAGATLVLMSDLPWVTSSLLGHTNRVIGTMPVITKAISSNGWLTLTGGATLVFMGVLMLASSVYALRIVTALLSLMTAGIASYDIVRLTQRIHDAQHSTAGVLATRLGGHIQLGYGIVVVVCVAFLALIVSLTELATRD